MQRNPHGPLGFKTHTWEVALRPGESLHYAPGLGYYAAKAMYKKNATPFPGFRNAGAAPQNSPTPVPSHPILQGILSGLIGGQVPQQPAPVAAVAQHPYLGHLLGF